MSDVPKRPEDTQLKLGFSRIKIQRRSYTEGTQRGQRAIRGNVRGALRISDALTRGLDSYRQKSNRSSVKKRDGEIRDLPKNVGRALEVFFREAGKAPSDIAKRLGTGRPYKNTRRLFRIFRW